MRKQKQIWFDEHASACALPSMANSEPSGSVVQFIEWLERFAVPLSGNAVDIGCGKGRNAVYLARMGFDVWALDYIASALDVAKGLANQHNVLQRLQFMLTEIDAPWPLQDAFFDIAIDSFASIDIESQSGRSRCIDEMYRTLKPAGYALVTVVSSDDEWEKELIAKYPGSELNSTVWPQNGKFQKNYDEQELRELYHNFIIHKLEKISKPAFKLGKSYTATNFELILQKPSC